MRKYLTKTGKVKLTDKPLHSVSSCIYTNIQKSLFTLKAYRLQLDTLGYIVDQGINDRSIIMAKVNKQINRHAKTAPINNAATLVRSCYLNGCISSGVLRKHKVALSIDHSLKSVRIFDRTIIEFARMIRKRKKKGLPLELKGYKRTL